MHFAHFVGGDVRGSLVGSKKPFCLKAIYIVSNTFLVNIPLLLILLMMVFEREIFKVLYSQVSLEFLLRILP